jgi:hypothetical protein
MSRVERFTLHNDRGQSVLSCDLLKWADALNPSDDIFGPVIRYSWVVDGIQYKRWNQPPNFSLHELPDASGFVGFERDRKVDNCLLLDAFGKERMRLTVPWQLTRPQNPESAKPPTSFSNLSDPYINPADGKGGEFGVTAWVELAGMYYFELDYHTGQFLWGREIRD